MFAALLTFALAAPPEPPAAPPGVAPPALDLAELLARAGGYADGRAPRVRMARLPLASTGGPTAGTVKVTAPDGTVTEYRVEFTPDPPASAPRPGKYRLGVALAASAGLKIEKVLEGSPAAKTGLKAGDRIIEVDDAAVGSHEELLDRIHRAGQTGAKLRIGVIRIGDPDADGEAKPAGEGERTFRMYVYKVRPTATPDAEATNGATDGTKFPHPYYLSDDVQFFPAGSEVPFPNQVEVIRNYRLRSFGLPSIEELGGVLTLLGPKGEVIRNVHGFDIKVFKDSEGGLVPRIAVDTPEPPAPSQPGAGPDVAEELKAVRAELAELKALLKSLGGDEE